MLTWSPLFSKLIDSSLWDEPDHVRLVWISMFAKKDSDHVVRATAYNIGRWARKTEAEVLDALRILSEPDKKRLEPQPFEGRRIKKVEDGWLMLNADEYEKLMRILSRKAYLARKQREQREKKALKGGGGARENEFDKGVGDGMPDSELEKFTNPVR